MYKKRKESAQPENSLFLMGTVHGINDAWE